MTQQNQPRTKYWVFTLNNPRSNDLPEEWPEVDFCFWQREKGQLGTEHLQGYVGFTSNKRRTWVNQKCTKGHWEPRKGNHEQAQAYSTKVETRIAGPWQTGEVPELCKGKRNDLVSLKRKLDEGVSEREIAMDESTFPVWAKYGKVIPRYRALRGIQRRWPTTTVVYWGAPGVGKSRRALDEGGPDAFWLSKPAGNTAWWDGYIGQDVVVIDEFYGWIARDLMCRICDRYPLNVETKGGSTPFLAKKIIITSNEHPVAWWHKVGLGAMERRLNGTLGKIVEMTVPYLGLAPPAAPAPPDVDLSWLSSGEILPPSPWTPVQPDPPVNMPVSPHQDDHQVQEYLAFEEGPYIDVRPLGGPTDFLPPSHWGEPVEAGFFGPVDRFGRSQPYEYE